MFPFYDWGAFKSHSIPWDMAHSDCMDNPVALWARDTMAFISNERDRAAKVALPLVSFFAVIQAGFGQ